MIILMLKVHAKSLFAVNVNHISVFIELEMNFCVLQIEVSWLVVSDFSLNFLHIFGVVWII